MSLDQHQAAVALALAANDDLGALFDELGSEREPVGIYFAYEVFLALLSDLWDTPDKASRSLGSFANRIEWDLGRTIASAVALGISLARRLLSVYDVTLQPNVDTAVITSAAQMALAAQMQAQVASVRAALFTGILSKEEVLGTADRIGLLNPAPIIRESARWIAVTASAVQSQVIDTALATQRNEWGLQAVSAIDERTTECCLRVHGVVVPLGEKFKLVGEPHFADEMENPPFHFYCRTVTALVKLEDFGDAMTENMKQAAFDEFTARRLKSEEKRRVPSSATSRRG